MMPDDLIQPQYMVWFYVAFGIVCTFGAWLMIRGLFGVNETRTVDAGEVNEELLDACKLAHLWLKTGQPFPHSDQIVMESLRQAIAKAEGK